MVGIIPKPIKKTSRIYALAPYVSFGLAIAVVLVCVILFYLGNKSSGTLGDLEEKLAQVGTQDEKTLETQVLFDKKQIDAFSQLFAQHQRTSNFFKFLEENCQPKTWFSKLELDSKESQAILTGETSNFEALGQQIVIFQNQEFVKNVDITDLSLGKNGRVSFIFSLSLNPEIFKSNE